MCFWLDAGCYSSHWNTKQLNQAESWPWSSWLSTWGLQLKMLRDLLVFLDSTWKHNSSREGQEGVACSCQTVLVNFWFLIVSGSFWWQSRVVTWSLWWYGEVGMSLLVLSWIPIIAFLIKQPTLSRTCSSSLREEEPSEEWVGPSKNRGSALGIRRIP